MLSQQKFLQFVRSTTAGVGCLLFIIAGVAGCAQNYPAEVGPPPVTKPVSSTAACACTTTTGASLTTTPGSTTISPGTSTTTAPGSSTIAPPAPLLDTLGAQPPHFSPNGGNFYMTVAVKLMADFLPAGAIIEYSVDNGDTWKTGQQFTLTIGGKVLTRLRSGTKLSPVRSAQFSIHARRMLIIGNSIMSHGPAPELGWFNFNGMAASAPEKDFVHLLTARLQKLYPALTVKLQSGGNFERQYNTTGYSLDEFTETLQQFKPDLIIVRIGENVDQGAVAKRDFETHYRQLLDRLATYGQPVRLICTTSVWEQWTSDSLIRKVTLAKGHTLVDLNCMVGQSQYFATQYSNKGVAQHPNDAGMQLIADLIWATINQ